MGKSERVRHGDLRSLYLLIGECKELGADPIAWRLRLVEGLLRLLDAAHGSSFDLEGATGPGPGRGALAPSLLVDAGISDEGVRRNYRAIASDGVAYIRDSSAVPNHSPVGPPSGTFTRCQMIDDRTWYGSDFVLDQMRLTGLDDFVGSLSLTGPGSSFSLGVHRLVGDRPFRERECRLLEYCVAEVLPLLGTRLATGAAVSLHALAPRLRQVLVRLFDGDGEKQIAARLKISRHTVHEYLRRLHRVFEARGRGELLARCAPYWTVLQGLREEV